MKRWPALVLAMMILPAAAQQPDSANGILLVAKPGMPDPRFSETVVLITQTTDFQTVGVILNRPLPLKLSELIANGELAQRYTEPVFFGGPVMNRTLVALFRADTPPAAPAFHVLKGVYLSMHPTMIEALLAQPEQRSPPLYRLYAGFAGWAPRQLESEMQRGDGWYMVPATAELVFRKDTAGMWNELLAKAQGKRAQFTLNPRRAIALY